MALFQRSGFRLAINGAVQLSRKQISTNFKKIITISQGSEILNSSQIRNARNYSTKSDKEVHEFLAEEIEAEKGNMKKLPKIEEFVVKGEGSELTLTKDLNGEKLKISLNVNHTVDSAEPDDGTQEAPEMKSKPNFEVDIIKPNGLTLSFTCSYINDADLPPPEHGQDESYDDVFTIDEVTMYEGEDWSDKKYAVAGDILDGQLYDLFMNMLEERGINNEFVDKLSDYCSTYEHSQYIKLLENLQKFVNT